LRLSDPAVSCGFGAPLRFDGGAAENLIERRATKSLATMKPLQFLCMASLAVTLLAPPASAADAAASKADPMRILWQMSQKIGGNPQFSFHAHRKIDPVLLRTKSAAADAKVDIAVLRPSKFSTRVTSSHGTRFYYEDGVNLTVFNARTNAYAIVPMFGTLDTLIGMVQRKHGYTPPLAQFLVSSPYNDMRRNSRTISYIGTHEYHGGSSASAGTECYCFALPGKVVDTELWIGVEDQLPRRMIATFKDRPGKPQIRVDFSAWNLRANLTNNDFVFAPPRSARRIPMMTAAKLDALEGTSDSNVP